MDSIDLSAALPTNHADRLLSESPLVGSSSRSNLSSSDLVSVHGLLTGHDGNDEEAQIKIARKAARAREGKLQNDLFLLKKLNSAFSLYTDALRATQSSTEVSSPSPPIHQPLGLTGARDLETEGTAERHKRVIGLVHWNPRSFKSGNQADTGEMARSIRCTCYLVLPCMLSQRTDRRSLNHI